MASATDGNHQCMDIEMNVLERTFGHLLSDLAVCIFTFVLMVIGIGANVLAILAYKRTKTLQTPLNYLLVILSGFNVVLAVTGQPLFIVWKIMELCGQLSCSLYIATVFTVNFFAALSFLVTTFLISLERYYSVFYPMFHRNHASKPFFTISVIIMAVVWFVFILGALLGNFRQVYFVVAVIVVISCLLGTTVGYVRIFHELSRRRSDSMSTESITDEEETYPSCEKTTLVNLVFIVGTMTIFYAPIGGCVLYGLLIGRDWLYMNYFMPWAYLFVFVSTAINPFLYGWKNKLIMKRSKKGELRKAFEETDL